MDVELEHGSRDPETNVTGDDVIMTAKIARAHLNEFPDYYTRLAKMEAEAEADGADQHQVTARPPGLRPHCHELVQGVAVHVGQFRQVNDYPCPGRGQYGERAHDVRGSAHIEFPAQRDDHAACARTFLCTDPGHGPRCHLWAACEVWTRAYGF
jgi:hypothetical protein